jgi:hypothetical protein
MGVILSLGRPTICVGIHIKDEARGVQSKYLGRFAAFVGLYSVLGVNIYSRLQSPKSVGLLVSYSILQLVRRAET